jgi:hypothetical protein
VTPYHAASRARSINPAAPPSGFAAGATTPVPAQSTVSRQAAAKGRRDGLERVRSSTKAASAA